MSNLSEQTLLDRAQSLAGFSLGELARRGGFAIPSNLQREKGWSGQLIEWCLGATAGNKQTQDFPELGIELKTIPINREGKPLETTYVCITPLSNLAGVTWENSNVRNKLSKVLWVPIIAERSIAIAERIVCSPILWSPSLEEDQVLKNDWEELIERISLGQVERITARHGEVLQLRPKAANNRVLTKAIGPSGAMIETNPRGFYLKKNFTQAILRKHFEL